MDETTLTREMLRQLLIEELPQVIREYPNVRYGLIGVVAETFARQSDIQSILQHLEALREDFNRQMAEFARRQDGHEVAMQALREDFNRQMAEFARRQDEFARRLDEFARRLDKHEVAMQALREDFNRQMAEFARRQDEHDAAMQALREDFNRQMAEFARQQNRFIQRIESHIGALGARWGLMAEEAFRTGLAGILDERLGLHVERFWQMDTAGQVFGQPDQVEIDVVLHNGDHWLMELKSSISRGEVYLFERKVAFYEQARGVKAKRKIIISPMVERGAEKVAASLGIEVYTSAYEFEP